MNKEETLALYSKGHDAWNAWADEMLAERARMEEAGTWVISRIFRTDEDKGANPETSSWLAKAHIDFREHTFSEDAEFGGYRFPGTADFFRTVFEKDAWFENAAFEENAWFTEAAFNGDAGFNNAAFNGYAVFTNAAFKQNAGFNNAAFNGDAVFYNAAFNGYAVFTNAAFNGYARFNNAAFKQDARFTNAAFNGYAWFEHAAFKQDAGFENAAFNGYAWFEHAAFKQDARFTNAAFNGDARFENAAFKQDAGFENAAFNEIAWFYNAAFNGYAVFYNAAFKQNAWFYNAAFNENAVFLQARFDGLTTFREARFSQHADFTAINVSSAFSLEGADFQTPPDFNQAHFDEAPRLDDAYFSRSVIQSWTLLLRAGSVKRWFGKSDLTHRWRELKRLAFQGHDHEREMEFFANETRARRWVYDFPFPCAPAIAWFLRWTRKTVRCTPRRWRTWLRRSWPTRRRPVRIDVPSGIWPGGARYWAGVFYELFSNFGRSIVRPVFWWLGAQVVFAWIYLGAHIAHHPAYPHDGAWSWVWGRVGGWMKESGFSPAVIHFPALARAEAPPLDCVIGQGAPWVAALYTSVAKGLVVIGLGQNQILSQAYACLYGLSEAPRLGANIPLSVAFASLTQTVFSTVLIFLLLLAIRNMFRIK